MMKFMILGWFEKRGGGCEEKPLGKAQLVTAWDPSATGAYVGRFKGLKGKHLFKLSSSVWTARADCNGTSFKNGKRR